MSIKNKTTQFSRTKWFLAVPPMSLFSNQFLTELQNIYQLNGILAPVLNGISICDTENTSGSEKEIKIGVPSPQVLEPSEFL